MSEEILKSLKKGPDGWDLSPPHLLYLSSEQSQSYLDAMARPDYSGGFHSDTVEVIEKNLGALTSPQQRSSFALIDLGPGFPDKTLPIVKHAKSLGMEVEYYPVDISKLFLDVASKEMGKIVKKVAQIHAKFEELPAIINSYAIEPDRLVMLGLTFMNFEPSFILSLLKNIAGSKGKVVVATELINAHNTIESILNQYKVAEAQSVAFGPLRQLGFSIEMVKYDVTYKNSRVEMSFSVIGELPQELEKTGIKKHDRILTAVSYRYTKEAFTQQLKKYFSTVNTFFSESRKTSLGVCL